MATDEREYDWDYDDADWQPSSKDIKRDREIKHIIANKRHLNRKRHDANVQGKRRKLTNKALRDDKQRRRS